MQRVRDNKGSVYTHTGDIMACLLLIPDILIWYRVPLLIFALWGSFCPSDWPRGRRSQPSDWSFGSRGSTRGNCFRNGSFYWPQWLRVFLFVVLIGWENEEAGRVREMPRCHWRIAWNKWGWCHAHLARLFTKYCWCWKDGAKVLLKNIFSDAHLIFRESIFLPFLIVIFWQSIHIKCSLLPTLIVLRSGAQFYWSFLFKNFMRWYSFNSLLVLLIRQTAL